MTSRMADTRRLVEQCRRDGWTVQDTTAGWRLLPDSGLTLSAHKTPSDRHAVRNLRADIRRVEQAAAAEHDDGGEHDGSGEAVTEVVDVPDGGRRTRKAERRARRQAERQRELEIRVKAGTLPPIQVPTLTMPEPVVPKPRRARRQPRQPSNQQAAIAVVRAADREGRHLNRAELMQTLRLMATDVTLEPEVRQVAGLALERLRAGLHADDDGGELLRALASAQSRHMSWPGAVRSYSAADIASAQAARAFYIPFYQGH